MYLEILPLKGAAHTAGFFCRLKKKATVKIRTVLTVTGKEFTDRFSAAGEALPTGAHAFDALCIENGIDHQLV